MKSSIRKLVLALVITTAMSSGRFEHMSIVGQVFAAAERDDGRMQAIIEAENIQLTEKNRAGQTLAHVAAKYANLAALRYVLEKEPTLIKVTDNYHCTVLHLATIEGSIEVVKYLVEEHGADIGHMSGRYRDRTAVHAAVEFNRLEVLKYFVEQRKIDFNRPNPSQTIPPLFLAVRNRNWDVIEYLVEERHANVRMLKSNEENILFVIVREDFFNLMKYLLDEIRVDFNVDWKNRHGETPVHVAAILNRMAILQYLVEKKHANVNIQKSSDQRTPLHYAASRDNFEICKFLIEHGADARLVDSYGDIPADKAKDNQLIEFLEHAAQQSRSPRSVLSPYSSADSAPPAPLPQLFEFTQEKSIGYHLPQRIPYVDGAESSFPSAVNLFYFQSFLLLVKSITRRIVNNKKKLEDVSYFHSPSSVIRRRMSSMAIDAVYAGPILKSFESVTSKSV